MGSSKADRLPLKMPPSFLSCPSFLKKVILSISCGGGERKGGCPQPLLKMRKCCSIIRDDAKSEKGGGLRSWLAHTLTQVSLN